MDKRIFVALGLAAAVMVVTPILFPTPPRPVTAGAAVARADSLRPAPVTTGVVAEAAKQPTAEAGAAVPVNVGSQALASSARAETVTVSTGKTRYRFSTVGAAPIGARMAEYRALTPGQVSTNVELAREGSALLSYRLLTGHDTVGLDRLPFTVDTTGRDATGHPLVFRTVIASGDTVAITYTFAADSYTVRVIGQVRGPVSAQALLIRMPAGLRSSEADTIDDQRHLAYVIKPAKDNAQSIDFGKVDTNEVQSRVGPFTWVTSKTKYFVMALLPSGNDAPFANVSVRGGTRPSKIATSADAIVTYPLPPDGAFAFTVYAGPQEWERLRATGNRLDETNPYGGWLRGIVQPFAGVIIRTLLWMHRTLGFGYGWVLVAFAVAVRILLWPLNQRAMRSNMRMQRIQPQMQEIQRKYKAQPEKQQAEMMKLYAEHNMSPFSMFSGCLPLLLPWPVFIALFFVFQNTIEFRGVSFMWMHDISLKDPFYILPVLMAASVFLLSWIGLKGAPDNPQAKTMAYVSPIMMFVFFFNIAGGLNLYYLVQNLVSLPQQWFIARERAKITTTATPTTVSTTRPARAKT